MTDKANGLDAAHYNAIVGFIWSIADDCLRDVYVRGKYRDVILPMTVIRRLDAILEDTKDKVLALKKKLDAAGVADAWPALAAAAGQAFCNASPFRLKDLTSRAKAQTLKSDFEAYLDGFSPNVQEILEKFKFRNQIATMTDADILGSVISKFVSPDINLSPNPVWKDDAKTILKHPGLDNHAMGTIFEELIRRFNEENNEEAGEHWTPRDVVELMSDLVFTPVADAIKSSTYTCYDGACGTGGMLTVAQERLVRLAEERGKKVSIHLFGQEINPETYAIAKADLLLKGDGEQASHISYGSTLSLDANSSRTFDFMLSNPPYGKDWKTDAEKMGGKRRAEYGKQIIADLSQKLTARFGRGWGTSNLEYMRRFYLMYSAMEIPQNTFGKSAASISQRGFGKSANDICGIPKFTLGWSHYLLLMRIADPVERAFYEREATQGRWTFERLERMYRTSTFERLQISKDKDKVRALMNRPAPNLEVAGEVLKDPIVTEFLGTPDKYSEGKLEDRIFDHIQDFMLEMGKGFTFHGRQVRCIIGDHSYYADLAFYNRFTRSFFVIDLKLKKVGHDELGQMQTYINYFDRVVKLPDENPTIGILLTSEKVDQALVEMFTPDSEKNRIFVKQYTSVMPSKVALKRIVLEEKRKFEKEKILALAALKKGGVK